MRSVQAVHQRPAAALLLLLSVLACVWDGPNVPLPPEAAAAAVPGDIDAERLDLIVADIHRELRPRYGPLRYTVYRLPASADWPAVQSFYRASLEPALTRDDSVYREGRRHLLAVWSARGARGRRMVAVAFVPMPFGGELPTHRVLILLTLAPS